MAFITEAQARAAGGLVTESVAKAALRASGAKPSTATFDVFLSHSYLDAVLVHGVRKLLERSGLSVYVDWIEDPKLDRSKVTATTAAALRLRLRNSRSLIFIASGNSPSSRWMPWELGFFDGFRPGHLAILPIVTNAGATFQGQEYLGLYPYVEDVPFTTIPRGLGIFAPDKGSATPVKTFAASGHR